MIFREFEAVGNGIDGQIITLCTTQSTVSMPPDVALTQEERGKIEQFLKNSD